MIVSFFFVCEGEVGWEFLLIFFFFACSRSFEPFFLVVDQS